MAGGQNAGHGRAGRNWSVRLTGGWRGNGELAAFDNRTVASKAAVIVAFLG
jgi:hypothetical protein